MKQMEDRFNHWAGYDYVFLNEEVRAELTVTLKNTPTDTLAHIGLCSHLATSSRSTSLTDIGTTS